MILPVVLGQRLLLNPVVLLVWLIFWGWLWGVPGALIWIGFLNDLFYDRSYIAGLGELSISVCA